MRLRQDYHRHFHPCGPMETSLVDQLVWLDWRRRRLVLGERAAHIAALQERTGEGYKAKEILARANLMLEGKSEPADLARALRTSETDDAAGLIEIDTDETMTRRGIALLQTGDPVAYAEALAVVREDTALWWEDVVSDDEQTYPDGQAHEGETYQPHSRTTASLLRFLVDDVMPTYEQSRVELARRPAIRLQAHGESLDPFRFDRILALDERLTRQLEKTQALLLRLQETRPSLATSRKDLQAEGSSPFFPT